MSAIKPIISIVIPIYNRLKITQEGLRYIAASVAYYNATQQKNSIRVVVVDDGSTDGSGEWVKNNYPDFMVLFGNGSLWWTGAANKGVQYSLDTFENITGIILQNDDVVVEKTWLCDLLLAAENHPKALIGCATTTPDHKDEIQFGGTISHPWFSRTKFKNKDAKRSSFPAGHTETSFYLSGRGLYVPASVFREIGLFDSKSFKHRGDIDIPLRAKKHGYALLVSYDAMVYELPQHTFGLDIKKKLTTKELYKAMTDFRSSYSFGYIYNYSRIATNNSLQFTVFFLCNFAFHMKALLMRYFGYA